jgi:hypothetical protein
VPFQIGWTISPASSQFSPLGSIFRLLVTEGFFLFHLKENGQPILE